MHRIRPQAMCARVRVGARVWLLNIKKPGGSCVAAARAVPTCAKVVNFHPANSFTADDDERIASGPLTMPLPTMPGGGLKSAPIVAGDVTNGSSYLSVGTTRSSPDSATSRRILVVPTVVSCTVSRTGIGPVSVHRTT